MRNSGSCPKCGDTRIAGPHRVHGGEGWAKIDLPGLSTATLDAYTCGNCGYTEMYADQMGLNNIRSSGRFLQTRNQTQQSRASCPLCGTPVRPGMIKCTECGYDLS
ncbi:MAG: zinc ribbon domain-containing protein [Candidatus Thorarchaeota archaeon]